MKKLNFIFLVVLGFTLFSCTNPDEVLVEYRNGDRIETIKRKDLRFIVKLNEFSRKEEASVAMQTQVLEELAFLNVAKLSYENLPEEVKERWNMQLRKHLLMHEEKAFLNAMNLYLQEKAENFEYKMLSLQLLFLKKLPNVDRTQEVQDILGKLNRANDEEIEKIIFDKNENLRYKILGGYLDPVCMNCGDDFLSFLINPFLKEEVQNTFQLVEDGNGYWLVRKIRIDTVKERNLVSVYEDYHRRSQFVARKFFSNPHYTREFSERQLQNLKEEILLDEAKIKEIAEQQAKHQASMLKRNSYNHHINELQKKYNFYLQQETLKQINTTPLENWNEDWVLFHYHQKDYKIRDFFDYIRKYQVPVSALSISDVAPLLNQVFVSYEILQLSEFKKNVEEYKQIFDDLITKQSYADIYIRYVFETLTVTKEEIQQYYELRKFNEFKVQRNGQEMILPLSAVEEQIRKNLLTEKRQKKIQEVKQKLFQEHNVKIFKEKLKEGKV